ncbi:uncharacterized protein LOC110851291 [Folsomia candida]|uniref:uncharacterized protein LOC110851291 n=1 Tax=Folsomia candida TaxID=158441 RepID=UPI000B9082E0|nr:uncharacterized protein LOC110851291 [Folsomia candida]XP_035708446.1 uncharacterized protein LOC110851291 [Folsomia candida]
MCLRMRKCCFCLDTRNGTILTAVACIAASLFTFAFIILGLVYWDQFSLRVHKAYQEIGLAEDTIDTCIKILWWGNIFTLLTIILYIILSIMLIIGASREEFKHMIPWISASFLLLPFVTFSFLLQLIFGIIGGGVSAVLVPAIVVLIWCVFWWYGFFCVVSHYRMLKGDIHRPVATLFRRDDY